jgi:hypothetical protein
VLPGGISIACEGTIVRGLALDGLAAQMDGVLEGVFFEPVADEDSAAEVQPFRAIVLLYQP